MSFHNSRLMASALFAGLLAMPGVAMAQSQEQTSPPATQSETDQSTEPTEQTEAETEGQTEAAAPTDEQLESFAMATIGIVRIQEAAQKQMQAAVEEAGLTIEEYNRIAQAAKSDPAIDQALQQLIQDRLGG